MAPRDLDRAVERMTAELLNWLPAERAIERSRNIAQALMDGAEPTLPTIRTMLRDVPGLNRALAITRTVRAWEES